MKPTVKGQSAALEIVSPRNRGGRPRGAEPMSTVSTWLPASVHDRLVQVAKSQDTSVSAILKQVIIINIVNIQK